MKKTVTKILAVLLSVAMITGIFAGCTRQVEIQCTCDCCAGAEGGGAGATDTSSIKALDNFTANGKSGVDCGKMPSSKSDILALYNAVANATKKAANMKYTEINDGAKIAVKTLVLDKSGKALGGPMMSAVQGLIDSFSPKPVTKNVTVAGGKVSEETAQQDGKDIEAKDVGRGMKEMLPPRDMDDGSYLTDADVADATIEQDGDYWKVTLTIADSEFSFVDNKNTPETSAGKVMATLVAADLITDFGGQAAITSADLQYKAPKVVAIIDPNSGYLAALGTYLDIFGHVTGDVKLMKIGGISGDLDKTTYYVSYFWESIG